MNTEREILDAIANHRHIEVGTPNYYNKNKVFVVWGYPQQIKGNYLILETANGIKAVAIDSILYINASENKFKKKREQRSNKKNYRGWEY